MDDNTLGRGVFRFMIFLLALNIVTLILLSTVIDVRSILNTPKGVSILSLGMFIFLLEITIFVIWNSVLTSGWKTALLAFSLNFFIAFTAEALGVNFGIIFGNYYYTELLGPQVFGVPILVALAWEPILYASFYITDILIPSNIEPKDASQKLILLIGLSLVGALATTAWDTMMDPFAVSRGWWVWRDGGPYTPYIENGVPISNFIGWLITAFVCQMVCRIIKDKGAKPRKSVYLSIYGPIGLYGLLFIQLLGVCIVFIQRPEVALIGLMCMGSFLIVALNMAFAGRRDFALAGNPKPGESELPERPLTGGASH